MLAQRMFGGGNASMLLLLFSVAAVTFYNAFYLQGALGYSPMKAGLANIPTAAGAAVGAPLGAHLVRRWSLRPIALPAITVAALSFGAVGFLDLHTPLIWIEVLLLVQGLSVGLVMAPVTGALISSLPLEQSGAGSAVTNTARQAGSVIGIAVGGTIMSIAYRGAIEPAVGNVPAAYRDSARVSAEQAPARRRHPRPALPRPGRRPCVHPLHARRRRLDHDHLPHRHRRTGHRPAPDRKEGGPGTGTGPGSDLRPRASLHRTNRRIPRCRK
ncbi:MFS transporter [Streptomyces sp. NPDC040750]|uniref:MFS transporter n=1 Tax=Streptomyces sp. NPDC040750 TaxID=3154491 RepID=UPI0033DC249B